MPNPNQCCYNHAVVGNLFDGIVVRIDGSVVKEGIVGVSLVDILVGIPGFLLAAGFGGLVVSPARSSRLSSMKSSNDCPCQKRISHILFVRRDEAIVRRIDSPRRNGELSIRFTWVYSSPKIVRLKMHGQPGAMGVSALPPSHDTTLFSAVEMTRERQIQPAMQSFH